MSVAVIVLNKSGIGTVAGAGAVCCVLAAPDGVSLLSGGKDCSVMQWRLQNGARLRQIRMGKVAVSSLACFASPLQAGVSKGFLLAVGARQVNVWHLPSASTEKDEENDSESRRLGKFAGHKERTAALCFSPSGRCLVSGGSGEALLVLWRMHSISSALGALVVGADGKTPS